MKRLNNFYLIPLYVAMIVVALFMINGCASGKIVDAKPATLESYRKQKNSTNFLLTVRVDSCEYRVFKWNSHCYLCEDANVPVKWDVVYLKNGSSYCQPVK